MVRHRPITGQLSIKQNVGNFASPIVNLSFFIYTIDALSVIILLLLLRVAGLRTL